MGLAPITNEYLNYFCSKGVPEDKVLMEAATDFLRSELKVNDDEMNDLEII